MSSQHFYVITGASGAGKSTLIAALGELGYSTVPEAALAFMREQLGCNGKILPTTNRTAFMEAVLARSIQDYEAAKFLQAPLFFDRGIPEWLRFLEPSEPNCQTVAKCRDASTVFVAEPWPEIYVCDHERAHSFDRAAKSYVPTIAAYSQLGYETCVLPKVSVQERVAFILAQVGAGAQQIAAADRHPATRAVGG
jgi:predicted ATPase